MTPKNVFEIGRSGPALVHEGCPQILGCPVLIRTGRAQDDLGEAGRSDQRPVEVVPAAVRGEASVGTVWVGVVVELAGPVAFCVEAKRCRQVRLALSVHLAARPICGTDAGASSDHAHANGKRSKVVHADLLDRMEPLRPLVTIAATGEPDHRTPVSATPNVGHPATLVRR